jgi:hypothetical protein
MKGNIKKIAAIALIALLTFGSSMSAFAASVTPTFTPGNDPSKPGYLTIKFDPPVDGTKTLNGMSITADFYGSGKWVSWTSNYPVEYVFVKGGNNGNMYHYPGGSTGDTALRAPNNNGGQQASISHVTFFFKLGKITINKEILGNPNATDVFEFEIMGPHGYSETVTITGEGSKVIEQLAYGEYTITEINIPANYVVDDDDKSVELKSHSKSKSVTFINRYDEPTTEEPTTEEPTTEEPTTEEPTTEEPTTEEPTTEEPTTEEPTTEEPTTEEPTTEEPTTEEPTTEEPTTEEPTTEEPTTETPTETPTEPPTETPTEPPTETPTEPPTEVITEEEPPLGPPIDLDEIFEPQMIDLDIIYDDPEFEEEIVLEEDVPLGSALPQTGQLPAEVYYGVGSVISLFGLTLKRRIKR